VSSVHHIWQCTKGLTVTWGQYRLCQSGKSCLGMWLWLSSTLMESVLQESPLTMA
jgi:hypothetical protein